MDSFRSKIIRFVVKNIASKGLSTNITPQAQRARLERLSIPYYYGFKYHRTPLNVAGIPAQWISSENADQEKVMLYFHGGAYTFGSPKTHRDLAIRLSRQCGVKVLIVDYRLAPETPFPGAVEDAFAAYQELLSTRDATQIIVMGDSAGGGLVMSLLLQNKRSNIAQPLCCVLLSPWVDLHCNAPSFIGNESTEAMLPVELLFKGAHHYLGTVPATEPLASPIFGPLKGLPPLMIQVGSGEILLDDSRMLAKKAEEAGVEVTLDIWPDCPHVWQVLWSYLPQAREAIDEIGVFVAKQIERAESLGSLDSLSVAEA